MMRALDDVNRVKLHEAHPLDETPEHARRRSTCRVFEQTLRAHQQQARLFGFNCGKVHVGFGAALYSRAPAEL